MPNVFLDPGEGRATKVNALFSRIAARYDLINDLQSFGLHRVWKRRVVALSGAAPDSRVLDVCCGTGDIALLFARNGAHVVGLDFNQPMLDMGLQRRARLDDTRPHAGSLEFLRGDAQQLPFDEDSFDVVTIGYGLRNLASWEEGLSEMLRVAKPGGRLLVLDFGKPPNPIWRQIYFAYLRLFVPILGRVCCGEAAAYAYILESLKIYPAQTGVATWMRTRGLQNVRVVDLLGGVMSINFGTKLS
jgi:demethylmenaquinone methyltransferase / 2-methoxy-6-polyprenyl-1,4-benzoquinol methylase